jgi:hypothetical protein
MEVLIFPNGPGVCLGHRGMQLAGVATCIVAYPVAMSFGMLRNSAL